MKPVIKITVLVENSVAFPFLPGTLPGMLGEHGLAVLVDNGREKVLYDTGRGRTLLLNLDKSGYKPEEIGKVILSHGHLDHVNSLQALLQTRKSTEVYCHPQIFDHKYGRVGTSMNYLGFSSPVNELEANGANFIYITEAQTVASNMMASGYIPRINSWEQAGDNFFIKKGETYLPDLFEDEQALFITHADGIIILTGCGHAGIINTIEHAVKCCGINKILAVIGGLHLEGASPERIQTTIKRLGAFEVEKLILGHCTGFEAICHLWQVFGDKVTPLSVGKQLAF